MSKLLNLAQKVGLNGFLAGLLLAIFLAWLFPAFGAVNSPIPWKPIINVGIALVFFLYGVKLDPAQIISGLSNWRLHVLIQSFTFLIFPVLVYVVLQWMPWIAPDFKLGVTYLSALPSTVSASIVMVSIAGGNIPAAIFNASISSLLGVILTPAWMGILGGTSEEFTIDFLPTLLELTYKVILPVIFGVFMHRYLFPILQPFLKKLKYIDQSVIMIIVFTAFAQSFEEQVFSPYSISTMITLAASMLGLFLLIWGVISFSASFLKFNLKDKITALFCGSKKSLVHGVVIGKVIFPDPAMLGLVLLPVMLYHIQQLIIGSAIASWFATKNKT
ncbi:bile acid:sodium symporter family protein [Algoriphagus hitonicola]|uniref:Solute carrier family 10 (Sodium/bile acid cotransporter), member 7 n=1 Tax=Algoriphagus hitonicola TaxID=435880 RepID=A0A1I2XDX9_9BACT|nr:bile acid:sodium symporter family protein [Algoriphagus hitonicola]SFH11698.1 solute carrier family 10 (sodium/bile acid cotransporter), member 7 [Algoriphagus hitonicola]